MTEQNDLSCMNVDLLDIYEALKVEEQKPRPHLNKSGCYHHCRKILVVWIIQASDELSLSSQTTCLICDLMDRFFIARPEVDHKAYKNVFQLIAMACISIGAKYEETQPKVPSFQELNALSDNTYSEEAVAEMELHVLQTLRWKINCVTPLSYLGPILTNTNSAHMRQAIVQILGIFVLTQPGRTLQDPVFRKYLPSELACAVLWCAHALTNEPGIPGTDLLQQVFKYTADDLHECAVHIGVHCTTQVTLEAAACGAVQLPPRGSGRIRRRNTPQPYTPPSSEGSSLDEDE